LIDADAAALALVDDMHDIADDEGSPNHAMDIQSP
jgi:hypothetical protein